MLDTLISLHELILPLERWDVWRAAAEKSFSIKHKHSDNSVLVGFQEDQFWQLLTDILQTAGIVTSDSVDPRTGK